MEKRMAQESDRISLLPGHIVDEILWRLPIKEAGRTSVLSTKWRYKWRSLPHLRFDNQCTWSNGHGQPSQNLVKIIDRVLMLHSGPIQSFVLTHTEFSAIRDIDHWMLHLSKVPVKGIYLYVYTQEKYKMPTFFFNCQHLIVLMLHGCSIKIPISFEGFKNLDRLDLQRVELSPSELEALISRCPLLTRLVLKYLEGITRLNLEAARNLMELDVRGAFQDVTFGVTNRLRSVTIGFYEIIENRQASGNANSSNFHKFFRNVHNIQILKIENYSLKYLAQGFFPWTLPHALVHLKHLSACVDFTSVKQIVIVICLIKSSPQLKKVEFQTQDPKNQPTTRTTAAGFWKLLCHSCSLEQVQVVSMRNIFGIEPELEFMKFLLTRSPNLQKMAIQASAGIAEGKLLRELLQSRRASAQAQVIIL